MMDDWFKMGKKLKIIRVTLSQNTHTHRLNRAQHSHFYAYMLQIRHGNMSNTRQVNRIFLEF